MHSLLERHGRRLNSVCRGVLVLLWWIISLEGAAFIALALWYGSGTPIADVWKEQGRVGEARETGSGAIQEKPFWIANDIVHPYLGYVQRPMGSTGTGAYYGFSDAPNTWIHAKKEEEIVIGIFGGSVANFFYYDGGEELLAALKMDQFFTGKKLRLVLFSSAGYKQPQQLLALNYYLSLSGHLDIAVNLDGFNELVLPAYDNIPKGVFPFYPRSWFFRISSKENESLLPILGQISYLQQKRSEWAMRFMWSPFRYSATGGFLWKIGDTYLARKIGRREQILLILRPVDDGYVVTGPRRFYRDDDEMVRDVVDHWGRNSLLMEKMSRANGIRYFHFLQPTGRYSGSKPLTAEEHRLVFAGAFPPTDLVNAGYPLLRKKGEELRSNGVRFTDLSMIFQETHKKLYYDVCHVEKEGSEMMARVIADAILQHWGE